MRGLRTTDTEKFKKYFSIIQEKANKQGCIFFLDTGEGRSLETEKYELEDVWGWLIPHSKASEFESAWIEWNDLDNWEEFYVLAEWSTPENPNVKFERYHN